MQDDVSKSERAENSTKKLAGDKSHHGIGSPLIKHIYHRNQKSEGVYHLDITESANQKQNYQDTVRGQLKTIFFIFANGPVV
jgi:hypothetical protein